MRPTLLAILLIFYGANFLQASAQKEKTVVYLIPGQGADARLYNNFVLDTNYYTTQHIKYFTPEKRWSLQTFAKELAKQIDTTQQFVIVGVSLGGMLATEMSYFLHPEKVIIISSAKNRNELPFGYRLQKTIPTYKIVPKRLFKMGAKVLQPIFEPDRRKEKDTFKAMLHDKDPAFLKRTTAIIMQWNRLDTNPEIIHIHGNNDSTIPSKNVKYNYLIDGGSHMMVLTQGKKISKLVNNILIGEG